MIWYMRVKYLKWTIQQVWQHKRTEIRIKIDSLHKTVALLSCSPHYKIAPCASHDGHLPLNLGIVAVIPYKSWAILRLLKTKTFPPYQLVNLLKSKYMYINWVFWLIITRNKNDKHIYIYKKSVPYLSVCNDIITDGVRALYLQNSLLVSLWHGLIIHPSITGSSQKCMGWVYGESRLLHSQTGNSVLEGQVIHQGILLMLNSPPDWNRECRIPRKFQYLTLWNRFFEFTF